MARRKLHDSIDRLAAEERKFLDVEFLAPVFGGGAVEVRIAGVVCRLSVTLGDFTGFGVFKPTSHSAAALVRPASLSERQKYLRLFPRVAVVNRWRDGKSTSAVAANTPDARFSNAAEVDLRLAEDSELFDTVAARFDGRAFWFEEVDPRADPAAAPYLRRALAAMTEPKALDRPALLPGQRLAYLLNYRDRLAAMVVDERTRSENRLREALAHAGAELRDFVERHGEYRVTFDVDGSRHVSVVRKDNLTIESAGICLSGQDRDFDLESLVGVLREAREQ
jgi:hypothetical protein